MNFGQIGEQNHELNFNSSETSDTRQEEGFPEIHCPARYNENEREDLDRANQLAEKFHDTNFDYGVGKIPLPSQFNPETDAIEWVKLTT